MKPFASINGKKYYLPQEVNVHRFELAVLTRNGQAHYLLCPKVKTRYRQATGAHLELEGNSFTIPVVAGKIVRRTFPLEGLEFISLEADWQAGGPISIQHEEPNAEAAASEE
jgi:hypothetical protein